MSSQGARMGGHPPEPPKSATFRLFVSSTFSDFQLEREALRLRVYPALEALARARGLDFQAIDLRWGVGPESMKSHETLRICLAELDLCQRLSPRPSLLFLLGDRYGWQPVPAAIPEADIVLMIGAITDPADRELFHSWYLADHNSVVVEWRLRELVDAPTEQRWHRECPRLLELLRRVAADVLDPTNVTRSRLYESATHQELSAGLLCGSAEPFRPHVVGAVRHIDDLPAGGPHLRDFVDLLPDGGRDPLSVARLTALRDDVMRAAPQAIFEVRARWGSSGGLGRDHLDHFCEQVTSRLSRIMVAELERRDSEDPDGLERSAHHVFAETYARDFVGRAALLERLERELLAPTPEQQGRPLVVLGPSGSGKTALLAAACRRLAQRSSTTDLRLIMRFVGATPESADPALLLRSLCADIARALDLPAELPPSDVFTQARVLMDLVKAIPPGVCLVVVIDALDQVQAAAGADPLSWPAWMPVQLPSGFCILATTTSVPEGLSGSIHAVEIDDLSDDERRDLIDRWLERAGRTLQPTQRAAVLSACAARPSPLYMKLIFEASRTWRSYDSPPPHIQSADVAATVGAMFEGLTERHGPRLVARTIGLLVSAVTGTTEKEIHELARLDEAVDAECLERASGPSRRILAALPGGQRLPLIVLARLMSDLDPYLVRRRAGSHVALDLSHRQLRVLLAEQLTPESRASVEADAIDYFKQQPAWAGEHAGAPNDRKVMELPHRLLRAGRGSELAQLLCDYSFLAAACALRLEASLVTWARALETTREDQKPWLHFILEYRHLLATGTPLWPGDRVLFQLAHAQGPDHPVGLAARAWHELGRLDWPAPVLVHGTQAPGLVGPGFAGHDGEISAVLERGETIATGSDDHTVRLWASATGECRAVLRGHGARIAGLAELDTHILSWADDGTARVWDPGSHCETSRFAPHARDSSPLVTPDGPVATFGGTDVRLWDRVSGQCLGVLSAESAITALQWVDGRLLALLAGGSMCSWALDGRREDLLGHTRTVERVLELPGRRLASCASDGKIIVWDLATSTSRYVFGSYDRPVEAMTVLPKERFATFAGVFSIEASNPRVRIWEVDHPAPRLTLDHGEGVVHWAKLIEGQWLVTFCERVVRIWDLERGRCRRSIPAEGLVTVRPIGEGRFVLLGAASMEVWDARSAERVARLNARGSDALVLPDGRLATWASGIEEMIGVSDFAVSVWSTRDFERQLTIEHPSMVAGARLSTSGRLLSWSSVLRISDLSSIAEEPRAPLPRGQRYGLRSGWLADGSLVVMDHSGVGVWNPDSSSACERITTEWWPGLHELTPGLLVWFERERGMLLDRSRGASPREIEFPLPTIDAWVRELRLIPPKLPKLSVKDAVATPEGTWLAWTNLGTAISVRAESTGPSVERWSVAGEALGAVPLGGGAAALLFARPSGDIELRAHGGIRRRMKGHAQAPSRLRIEGGRAMTTSPDGVVIFWDLERFGPAAVMSGFPHGEAGIHVVGEFVVTYPENWLQTVGFDRVAASMGTLGTGFVSYNRIGELAPPQMVRFGQTYIRDVLDLRAGRIALLNGDGEVVIFDLPGHHMVTRFREEEGLTTMRSGQLLVSRAFGQQTRRTLRDRDGVVVATIDAVDCFELADGTLVAVTSARDYLVSPPERVSFDTIVRAGTRDHLRLTARHRRNSSSVSGRRRPEWAPELCDHDPARDEVVAWDDRTTAYAELGTRYSVWRNESEIYRVRRRADGLVALLTADPSPRFIRGMT